VSKDVHYVRSEVPREHLRQDTVIYGWKGERVDMEVAVFSKIPAGRLSLRVKSDRQLAARTQVNWVSYVLTDSFRGCGEHPSGYAPYLVNDMIDTSCLRYWDTQIRYIMGHRIFLVG